MNITIEPRGKNGELGTMFTVTTEDNTILVYIDKVHRNRFSYALLLVNYSGQSFRMTVPQLCEILNNIKKG